MQLQIKGHHLDTFGLVSHSGVMHPERVRYDSKRPSDRTYVQLKGDSEIYRLKGSVRVDVGELVHLYWRAQPHRELQTIPGPIDLLALEIIDKRRNRPMYAWVREDTEMGGESTLVHFDEQERRIYL